MIASAVLASWMLLSVQANHGLQSVEVMPSERACREAVCQVERGSTCADALAADARREAEQAAKEKAETLAAKAQLEEWRRANPRRVLICDNPPKNGAAGDSLSWSQTLLNLTGHVTGWDGGQCGPEIGLNAAGISTSTSMMSISETIVVSHVCSEAAD